MKTSRVIFLFLIVAFFSGCAASVISEEALKDIDRNMNLATVQSDPQAHVGRKVLWGGIIISTKNLPDHTRIEVLAKELTYMDMPELYDRSSQGRFIILAPGFYDKLVYKPGLGITVAGVIKGTETIKIEELSYPYILISPIEMRTFGIDEEPDYYDHLYWRDYPYYGPYGPYPPYLYDPYDPFFDPYFGPYYPGLPPYFYPGGYEPLHYRDHYHKKR
jgi:outer membrane lipoprotein